MNTDTPIAMCDIDGVIAQFAEGFHRWTTNNIDISIPEPTYQRFNFPTEEWEWTPQQFAAALDQFAEQRQWETLNWHQPAVDSIERALTAGHHIRFVTARPDNAWNQTRRWLTHTFGPPSNAWSMNIEPTPKAGGHRYTIGFDDLDTNAESLAATGCPNTYLVDRPWNQHRTDLARINEADIGEAIIDALTTAKAA